jgi:integrase/recombinase XerD
MSRSLNNSAFLNDSPIDGNNSARKLLDNPLIHQDTWHTIDDLGLNVNQHSRVLTISFNQIEQDWLKLLIKLYCLVRVERRIAAAAIRQDLCNLNRFSHFIEQKSIFRAEQINGDLFDEFEFYLKFLKLSPATISGNYIALNNFFNICREEGWLEVNTYWFKGRQKRTKPKNDEIEYIPEEVWQQLDENLYHLPESLQRMVLLIRATGLRIGELLNLSIDCLRQRDRQWRLRFLTEKYQTVDEIPICEELVAVIKEQQKYIKKYFSDSYNNLFASNTSGYRYTPAPRVMSGQTFNQQLNTLAKQQNICTNDGRTWHFNSHQFRRTLATVMTNAGVRDLIIQKYLRHRSPDMQNHYKHLLKEVLGAEYQELMKGSSYVNSTGKIILQHQPQNPITELVRRKMYQITTQHGECHRPVLKSPCQTINACWQCEHWLTSIDDLSALQEDFKRVKTELDIATNLGMVRQQQILTTDRNNLMIRIEVLETIDDGD